MKVYRVQINKSVVSDIDQIKDFIVEKVNYFRAQTYAAELYAEIMSLSYLADYVKETTWETGKKYSKHEKVLLTRNRKWSIFFHTYRDIVIVDKIMPQKMVKG